MLKLESSRLILMPLAQVSAEAMCEFYLRNKDFFKPTDPPHPKDFFTTAYWERRLDQAKTDWNEDKAFRWVLMTKESHIMGFANFSQVVRGPLQACYLGYGIDEKFQRQGYMTEALTGLISWLFKDKNIHRIMANYIPTNEKSGRVLEKLGFVKEGIARNYLFINGEWRDHVMTSLTSVEWRNVFT